LIASSSEVSTPAWSEETNAITTVVNGVTQHDYDALLNEKTALLAKISDLESQLQKKDEEQQQQQQQQQKVVEEEQQQQQKEQSKPIESSEQLDNVTRELTDLKTKHEQVGLSFCCLLFFFFTRNCFLFFS
jgi:predicted  nucleic acid-binding Zn-ribbon protein